MVLSYLASYVYTPSSSSSSTASSSSSSAPSRANSVRRTGGGRHGSTRGGAAAASRATTDKARHRNGNGNGTGTIAEELEDEKGNNDATDTSSNNFQLPNDDPALALIHYINSANSLYDVVGISKNFTSNDDLRRAYMARCRVCHPE